MALVLLETRENDLYNGPSAREKGNVCGKLCRFATNMKKCYFVEKHSAHTGESSKTFPRDFMMEFVVEPLRNHNLPKDIGPL